MAEIDSETTFFRDINPKYQNAMIPTGILFLVGSIMQELQLNTISLSIDIVEKTTHFLSISVFSML